MSATVHMESREPVSWALGIWITRFIFGTTAPKTTPRQRAEKKTFAALDRVHEHAVRATLCVGKHGRHIYGEVRVRASMQNPNVKFIERTCKRCTLTVSYPSVGCGCGGHMKRIGLASSISDPERYDPFADFDIEEFKCEKCDAVAYLVPKLHEPPSLGETYRDIT